ncbi:phage holin family protein, partial [Ruminococcus sp. CAG:57]
MKENTAKIIISAIAAGLSAYFRVMAIPIVILVLVMIIDYITGMWKAWSRGELSSRVGLKGLFKKVGYIFVVAVSGVLDWLFISGLSQIGIEVSVSFYFGLIVTIWFIINECIS